MKKSILITTTIILILFSACKKEKAADNRSVSKSILSFNYNGKLYKFSSETDGVLNWSASETSISIDRPDLFNGKIEFPRPGCAYFIPAGRLININANCAPSFSDGLPGDPPSIYTYQSGSVSLSYSNCETRNDGGGGIFDPITYMICDGNGTFDLTLKNEYGNPIVITNGKIELYNTRR